MTGKIYILSAVRTPIGKFGKSLREIKPQELGSIVIEESMKRANVQGKEADIVIMGNVLRAGHGQDLARQASIRAGVPNNVDAYCVDMVCSSGMMSLINAYTMIKSGESNLVVAGGMESMSQSPLVLPSKLRWGVRHLLRNKLELIDSMYYDGLTDPFNFKVMGEEADMVAKQNDIKREELDEIGYSSHMRAYKATINNYFKDEIVPIRLNAEIINRDEGINQEISLDSVRSAKPVFSEDGLHTVYTSSQLSDGASSLVIASEEFVRRRKLEPLAEILGFAFVGTESWRYPEAPIFAIRKLLEKTGFSIDKIDFIENNEAFAVNSVLLNKAFKYDYSRLNVFGGAIALGHPIGASGARIVTTLINVLKKNHGEIGIASICHGIGGATAMALRLLS